ncbi:MAG TPA: hypothetical protein VKX16_17795 [Chloroflexota bacterium]|nr:hypothetical protein [Chloroflexota bacterium]
MTALKLAQLCDRVALKLYTRPLDELRLLDLATMLMFVQWDLQRAFRQVPAALPAGDTLDVLSGSLRWVQLRTPVTGETELREHVETAYQAAVASVYLLQYPRSTAGSEPAQA